MIFTTVCVRACVYFVNLSTWDQILTSLFRFQSSDVTESLMSEQFQIGLEILPSVSLQFCSVALFGRVQECSLHALLQRTDLCQCVYVLVCVWGFCVCIQVCGLVLSLCAFICVFVRVCACMCVLFLSISVQQCVCVCVWSGLHMLHLDIKEHC